MQETTGACGCKTTFDTPTADIGGGVILSGMSIVKEFDPCEVHAPMVERLPGGGWKLTPRK